MILGSMPESYSAALQATNSGKRGKGPKSNLRPATREGGGKEDRAPWQKMKPPLWKSRACAVLVSLHIDQNFNP
jgi:hypothetical protein